jgi:periplasmic divalent cation tolerance protein
MAVKQVAVILAAYPRKAPAARAARTLVRDGILACATVAPGATAFYRWEGRLVEEGSVLLWGKTSPRGAARAVAAIRALHPDRVPEILVFRTAGALPAYAAWVAAATGGK